METRNEFSFVHHNLPEFGCGHNSNTTCMNGHLDEMKISHSNAVRRNCHEQFFFFGFQTGAAIMDANPKYT